MIQVLVGQFGVDDQGALKGRDSKAQGTAAGGALGRRPGERPRPEGARRAVVPRTSPRPCRATIRLCVDTQGTAYGGALGCRMAPFQGAETALSSWHLRKLTHNRRVGVVAAAQAFG